MFWLYALLLACYLMPTHILEEITAIQRAKSALEASSDVSFSVATTIQDANSQELLINFTTHYSRLGNNWRVIPEVVQKTDEPKKVIRISDKGFIKNDKYFSVLSKNAKLGGWVLESTTMSDQEPEGLYKKIKDKLSQQMPSEMYKIGDDAMWDLVSKSSKTSTDFDDNEKCILVKLSVLPASDKEFSGTYQIYLHRKDLSFAISKVVSDLKFSDLRFESETTFIYKNNLLSQKNTKVSESQGGKLIKSIVRADDYAYIDTNDIEDYTLSAFGLPEPEGVVWEKPTPVWVWLVVAAGVLAAMAVLFRYWQKRIARRAAAT
jgi:hypothetical protein